MTPASLPAFSRSTLYVFSAVVVVLWGLHAGSGFIIPVLLAALLAFLMAPVMRVLRKLRLPEWACVIVSALMIILPLAGFVYLAVSQIQALVEDWPKLSDSLMRGLSDFRQSGVAARLHLTRVLNPAGLQSKLQTSVGSELKLALTSLEKVLSAGSLLVLTIFFAVAMLASKRHLKAACEHLLFSYTSIDSTETVNSMATMMESFLVARMAIATGLGLAGILILLGFGIPYSFLLGAFLGLMTWVPIVGFLVGIIPVIAVGFATGKGIGTMLGVFLTIAAVWSIQDHVITPKWVGHRLKLNFLATYLAFFAGGLLWGAWGMFLSIPLLGLIRIACSASPNLRPWAFALGETGDQHEQSGQPSLSRPSNREGVISRRIKESKETILHLWELRCRAEVPSAGTGTSLALRDSVPIYLDHLSEALALNRKMDFRAALGRDEESTRIGKLHGSDRAGNRSYILTEVIFEYHILREVIFQVLETQGPLGNVQRDIILNSIEQAVNDTAVEFSEVHADIQQKFINTLTHDLKNPITVAKANADIILKRPDTSEASVKSTKGIIVSLNRLVAMIHDLLDANRIRAGEQLALNVAPGDLDKVIREVVDEMAIIHGDRFVVNSKGPIEGEWDCDALRRAIENLIGNAVKYGEHDAPITISLRQAGAAVELIVHNEGPPISEAEIPLLFQIYRRSRSAQEGTKSGWGLGLTLVKGVVDGHKGSIRVESAAGKGTSFILSIPKDQKSSAGKLRSAS